MSEKGFRKEKKMDFRKAATSSVVWAATAFALTADVNAQVDVPGVSPPVVGTQDVADPEISDGAITRNGRLNADAATDAPPAPQAATGSVGVDASGTGADASAQTNNNQPTVDAAASAATPGDGSGADADIDANNQSQIRRFKSDQLGATFDSNYNDPAGGGGYGSTVGVAPCGPNPWSGQSCYNGSCHVHQMYWCGSRYSGGRRHHRRCCR
ncbi:MAG: hypothetical protein KDB01_14915 [Planctomycetaceae bacterium]|nr:hypothetical protein [Planctomycetaceae bacterium]